MEDIEEVKACKREIVGYYTRGTFKPALVVGSEKRDDTPKVQNDGFDNRFVLIYVRNSTNTAIGFTFFDLTILKFYSGSIKSMKQNLMHKFRTLLMQVRPLECVALHSEL